MLKSLAIYDTFDWRLFKKSVFPQHTTRRFKKEFAFVGKLSNQLRDLDVYLLKEDTFKTILPPVLRDDIEPLFDYLRESRSRFYKKSSMI